MLKIVLAIAALCLICRWALGKWPWDYLTLTSTRSRAQDRARLLLGVDAGAGREEIIGAHRRLTALVHPDRGGTTAAMQEANAARDLLLADLPGASGDSSDGAPPPQSRD
jgi:hypothetical protein